jgi:hypothetical protein
MKCIKILIVIKNILIIWYANFCEHLLVLLVRFFDMNIEKVLDDQKIMLGNY